MTGEESLETPFLHSLSDVWVSNVQHDGMKWSDYREDCIFFLKPKDTECNAQACS